MNEININTTYNVFLEFKAADIVQRIVASLIDAAIIATYYTLILIIFLLIFGFNSTYLYLILFMPVLFYDLILESLWNGQSIGKYAMKIRVIRTDGLEPTFVQYFIRWILRLIDINLSYGGIATITVLINGRGQRIGDIAAKTTVISLKDQTKLSDTILSNIEEQHIPEFPEAVKLSDKDITTCLELLKANELPEIPESVIEANYRVKSILENKMGIKTDKQPLDFIDKVVKDYNYFNLISN